MVGGVRPYSLEISAKGMSPCSPTGGARDIDVINVVDLKAKPPRIVDTISVGQTPEGVAMSGDGYLCRRHGDERFEPSERPSGLQRLRLVGCLFDQGHDSYKSRSG